MISDELTNVKESVVGIKSAVATNKVSYAAATRDESPQQNDEQETSSTLVQVVAPGLGNKPPVAVSASKNQVDDRRMNLVVFGLPESKKGTRRQLRIREDFEKAGGILSLINPAVSDRSIRDCRRLGKFKDGTARPVLLQLHRSVDVSIILSG